MSQPDFSHGNYGNKERLGFTAFAHNIVAGIKEDIRGGETSLKGIAKYYAEYEDVEVVFHTEKGETHVTIRGWTPSEGFQSFTTKLD